MRSIFHAQRHGQLEDRKGLTAGVLLVFNVPAHDYLDGTSAPHRDCKQRALPVAWFKNRDGIRSEAFREDVPVRHVVRQNAFHLLDGHVSYVLELQRESTASLIDDTSIELRPRD